MELDREIVPISPFVTEILASESERELGHVLERFTRLTGYERYLLSQFDAITGVPEPIIVSNFPDGWIAWIVEEGAYRDSPGLKRALVNTSAFEWSRASEARHREREYHQSMADFGLREGLNVPLHIPGIVSGIFAVANRTTNYSRERSDPAVQFVAAHAFDRLYQITRAKRGLRQLDGFQVELLALLAKGRSRAAIAVTVGRSRTEIDAAIGEVQQLYRATGTVGLLLRALASHDVTLADLQG